MAVHWLVNIARAKALPGSRELELESGVSNQEAWPHVALECGMTLDELGKVVGGYLNLDVANIEAVEPHALKLLPESFVRKNQVVPVRESNRHLVVATCDPLNPDFPRAVRFSSGRDPIIEVAHPDQIKKAIETYYSPDDAVASLLDGVDLELLEDVSIVEESEPDEVDVADASAAPVIKLTSLIIHHALEQRASDIHFEPGHVNGRVRFRVDGVLRTHMQMPMQAMKRVVSRIKILSKLDIADKFRPQDGRASVFMENKTFDLRISTVPIRESEKVVIRIMDPKGAVSLTKLGIPEPEISELRSMLASRDSIVLVTGPTGSGKTTTLYAALNEIVSTEINIMTVEDPVEYDLPGISQIQVESKREVTFASSLRALLRQDPDVILIGEIRDLETATIATQASMTGHLVLSTLHTNDAASAVTRLVDLGLDRPSIASTLRGIVAQRLLRKICNECVLGVDGELNEDEKRLSDHYGVMPVNRASGCEQCGHTGYFGRQAVVELITVSERLQEIISQGATTLEIRREASASGARTMIELALEAVRNGDTTLQEVERVLGGNKIIALKKQIGSGDPHILVVDDDAVIRIQARGLLEKNGFVVTEAQDGEQAIELLKTDSRFSLVVTDLNMPRIDGWQLLAHLQTKRPSLEIPVMVLTGSGNHGQEAKLMSEGADDYIEKPIDPARFIERVQATLRRAA